jgi:hypothetical protein
MVEVTREGNDASYNALSTMRQDQERSGSLGTVMMIWGFRMLAGKQPKGTLKKLLTVDGLRRIPTLTHMSDE